MPFPDLPTASEIAEGLAQLVWPPRCLNCGVATEAAHFCETCLVAILTDHPHLCRFCAGNVGPHVDEDLPCPRCHGRKYHFASATRFGLYDGVLRDVVLRMKHQSGELLAGRLGDLWATQHRERLLRGGPQLIVPVPLHWRKRWQRGYNQACELALGLGRGLDLPVWGRCLRRRRSTPIQTTQSATARWENVRGAFRVGYGHDVKALRVLLVDDVLTTGATCHFASQALLDAGAAQVTVAVVAHR